MLEGFDLLAVEEADHESSVVGQRRTKGAENVCEGVRFVVDQGVPSEDPAEGTGRQVEVAHRAYGEFDIGPVRAGALDERGYQIDSGCVKSEIRQVSGQVAGSAADIENCAVTAPEVPFEESEIVRMDMSDRAEHPYVDVGHLRVAVLDDGVRHDADFRRYVC